MEKKILIAVDGSVNAMDAVHYAAQLGVKHHDFSFTLIHIQPALSQYLVDEARINTESRRALEKAIKKNDAQSNSVLSQAAERMMSKGIDETRISRQTLPKDTGVANDLLSIGQAKPYDAILVGRRGVSYLREWIMGSVAANLVEHSKVIPIWVVDGTVDSTEVLLAADGSQASLSALDHMAFMLAGNESLKLHVLHVRPRFKDFCEIDLEADTAKSAHGLMLDNDQRCMDDFYGQALEVLKKYHVDQNRFEVNTLDGRMSISRSVVEYVRDNRIGTIVLGRRGTSKNPFTGSVSRSILNKSENMALWVVP